MSSLRGVRFGHRIAGIASYRSAPQLPQKNEAQPGGQGTPLGAAPLPFDRQTHSAGPGYVIDQATPLKPGRSDSPSYMQWQTTEAAKFEGCSLRLYPPFHPPS